MPDQDELESKYYGEALEIGGFNALALKAMCLWAFEHRENKDAMKAASAAWGRNARHFAKAIECFGMDFRDEDGYVPLSTDDILSRVAIASLPFADAHYAYAQMKAKTLTYWQVRELVQAAKPHRTRKPSLAEWIAERWSEWEKMTSAGSILYEIRERPEVARVLAK